jgi:hypothetical protein
MTNLFFFACFVSFAVPKISISSPTYQPGSGPPAQATRDGACARDKPRLELAPFARLIQARLGDVRMVGMRGAGGLEHLEHLEHLERHLERRLQRMRFG